ncbi:MAG: LysM peptidoglycan-binding domain-containing protein [Cetobacterium sp.]|uniref:LysM peptidoglycan-binding domain-containing protein n=1 Tax=Cetobacterium sp. TaxID=2071632 RepID=UPI003EE79515
MVRKDNKVTKAPIKNNEKIYVVKFGDTLSLIAKNVNLPIDYLAEINNIKNKNLIITNQKLILNK